jgi:hypothetical protein
MFLNSWFRHRRGGQAHVFEGTGKHCADKACTLCAQSWAVKAMGSKTSIVFITWADEGRHSGRGDSFRKCRRYQISRTAFMVIPCCSARNDDVWSRGVCCSLVRKIAIASCASSVDTDLKPSCSIDTDMKALESNCDPALQDSLSSQVRLLYPIHVPLLEIYIPLDLDASTKSTGSGREYQIQLFFALKVGPTVSVPIHAFHGVVLPRFPGGPAGLYLKLMLAVLNKCVHTWYIHQILTLVICGSPYQSHTTKCICVDLRFFFYFRK